MEFVRRLRDRHMHDRRFGIVRRGAIEIGDGLRQLRLIAGAISGRERSLALAAAPVAASAAPSASPAAALAVAIGVAGRLAADVGVLRIVYSMLVVFRCRRC
jgi:hypothetical protein